MTSKPSIYRQLPYLVAAPIGTLVFVRIFRSLLGTGPHPLAVLVPADLAAAALSIGIVYPFMRRASLAEASIAPIPARTRFAVIVVALAVMLALTIISRDWWLAVEMLVFVSILAGVLAYRTMGVAPGVGSAGRV